MVGANLYIILVRKKFVFPKNDTITTYESAKFVSENCSVILNVEKITAQYIRYLAKHNKSINGFYLSYA